MDSSYIQSQYKFQNSRYPPTKTTIAAVLLLVIMLALSYKKVIHLSNKMLLFNSGLIVAGIPFQQVQSFSYIFWIIGGVLVVFSIAWYFYDKLK